MCMARSLKESSLDPRRTSGRVERMMNPMSVRSVCRAKFELLPAWFRSILETGAITLMALAVASGVAAERPLKVLLVTSGGYHDYKALAPFLSTNLSQLVNATIEAKSGLDVFADPKFAEPYDAIIYDI